MTTNSNKPNNDKGTALRPRDSSPTTSRLKEIFKDYDPSQIVGGRMKVKNLDPSLIPCFATNNPVQITEWEEYGYRDVEEVQCLLEGGEGNNTFVNKNTGNRVKVMVALREQRDERNDRLIAENQAIDNQYFKDDPDLPRTGVDQPPPSNYVPQGRML